MATDTIEAIRNAEMQSDAAEKQAHLDAEEIVKKADSDAAELKISLTKEALAGAKSALEAAELEGAKLIEAAKSAAQEDTEKLRKNAATKEDEAIQLIIKSLS